MSRWFRFYDEVIHDAKILRLSDEMFRVWVTFLCFASKFEGKLPPAADIAATLREKPAKVAAWIAGLRGAGLLDEVDGAYVPHNWNGRQYQSDVSTPRVKRFRQRKRNVSETPPEADAEQKQTEAIASGADAPDPRKRLFDDGLAKLARMTGKGPDACRSFVGKCLKAAGDDAIVVLGLIEDAERNQVINPSAWIAARLKTGETHGRPKSAIIQAADDLVRKLAEFDGPSRRADDLRSIEGEDSPRLLSHG